MQLLFPSPVVDFGRAALPITIDEELHLIVRIVETNAGGPIQVTLRTDPPNVVSVPAEIEFSPASGVAAIVVKGLTAGASTWLTASTQSGSFGSLHLLVVDAPPAPVLFEPLAAGGSIVSGRATAGSSVQLAADGALIGRTIASSEGVFVFDVPRLDGGVILEARSSFQGKTSAWSPRVVVREQLPVPTVLGNLVEGETLVASRGVPGATIRLSVNGSPSLDARVGVDGRFSVPVGVLQTGDWVAVTQTLSGEVSAASRALVIDRPAVASIGSPLISGGRAVMGTGAPGVLVDLYVNGLLTKSSVADTRGFWICVLGAPLRERDIVVARQTIAGVASALSKPTTVIAEAPQPDIELHGRTDQPVARGTGVPGSVLQIFVDEEHVGESLVGHEGRWVFHFDDSLRTSSEVGVVQTIDDAISKASPELRLEDLKESEPALQQPIIAGATAVKGLCEARTTCIVLVNGSSAGFANSEADGAFAFPLDRPMAIDDRVQVANRGGGSTRFSDIVRVQPRPPPPAIEGPLVAGQRTLWGAGLPHATIEVAVDGRVLESTAVNSRGEWALDLAVPLEPAQLVKAKQAIFDRESQDSSTQTVGDAALVSIEIDPSPSVRMARAQALQFHARGTYSDGTPEDPLFGVQWSTGDSSVATVNASGLASASSQGTTPIWASREGLSSPPTAIEVITDAPGAEPGALSDTQEPASDGSTGAVALLEERPPAAAALPTVEALSPVVGDTASETFTFSFADPDGASDIAVTNVLINDFINGVQACYLAFVPSGPTSGSLFLVDDAGNAGGPFVGMLLPSSDTISNSQCSISGSGSSVSSSGTTLALTLNVSFNSAFAGDKVVYMAAADTTGGNSGWQPMGVRRVPPFGMTFPYISALNPNQGAGLSETFSVTYRDVSDGANIRTTQLLINSSLDGGGACYVAIDHTHPAKPVYLLNDAGGALLSAVIPGDVNGMEDNSQCTLFGQGTSISVVGQDLVVTLRLAFKAGFPGRKILYAGAQTLVPDSNSGWQAVGAWVIAPSGPPMITDFTPKTAKIGDLITVLGTNLAPPPGTAARVDLAGLGGGTVEAPIASATATALTFTVPTGVDTGPVTATIGGAGATAGQPLVIVPSSEFTLNVSPSQLNVIRGETGTFAATLQTADGFSQLADLQLTGLPAGVTPSFKPQLIGAGQTSVIELTVPTAQALGPFSVSFTASAMVDGFDVTAQGSATLTVDPVTTSFVGRTVVADTLQTPLAGVTVTMLGQNGNGGATGCSGQTVSDSAGNFSLKNLAANCVGPQLVGYDGTTAVSPPGKYAGVNIVYTLTSGQVTKSPVLVHLPRIDDQETFFVTQNAPVNQTYSFQSVPGLSLTVYAGTTFTMPDGSQPNPFPLVGVQVPVDRLPDYKPPVPTMVSAFIVAFQPANAVASQPVAVFYPNTLNTPPGVNMTMMTLDPTLGRMVPYGTGTVSADGTQITPDLDPAFPGRRYGIVNFDWHGPMPPGPDVNPGFEPICAGKPVDLSSGLEVLTETDIAISGLRGSIFITRTYRTISNEQGPFGIGASHNYGYRLDTNAPQNAAVVNLIFPDGKRAAFARGATSTFTNGAVPALLGTTMTVVAGGAVDLRWRNGTVWRFVPSTFQLGSVLESITDPNGNVMTLQRDASRPARITEVIDPVGRKLVFQYDAADRITSITDPIDRAVLYTYNSQGTLETVTNPANDVTRYEYDAQNRLTQVTDARGIVVARNTYDATGRVAQQVLANGGVLQFSYTLANPLMPTSPVISTTVTDPLGRKETYRFNLQGFLIEATDALDQTRIYEREPGTNLRLSVRGAGSCNVCGASGAGDQVFTYDAKGNVLTSTDALGFTTAFAYEPTFNKLSSVTDPLNNATSMTYDATGNLLSTTDARGNTTSFTYDSQGLLLTITDPLPAQWNLAYDALGNLTTATDPMGNVSRVRYDLVSRPVEVTDALGRRTALKFDAQGRVVNVTDALGRTTLATYDAIDNLLSVTDARNNTTTFAYDAAGRLQTRIDSLGNADTRIYDLDGNMTNFTDRRGQAGNFAYDALGRLVSEAYADGSTVTRSFDLNNRLIRAVDSLSGSFAKTYDLAGGLLSETGPNGAVTYIRDALGRATRRQVVGQGAVEYVYDPVGNLLSAVSPAALVGYAYDNRNQVTQEARGNGVSTANSYDALGRLLTKIHSNGSTTLDSQAYVYDAVGRIVQKMTDLAQPLTTQPSINAYDLLSNRLTQGGARSYTHDKNGNRLTETGPSGTTSYVWDGRNRLQSLSLPTGGAKTFEYDYAGNLIREVISGTLPVSSRTYVLDDLTNVAQITDSSGRQLSILSGQSVDQHLAVTDSGGISSFGLTDQINSTTQIVDDAGVSRGQSFYEPFGETSGTDHGYPFQFTGRVPVLSNLYYYRARFYDSVAGRFISEDPLGIRSGDANRYRYVLNRPTDGTDPLGLKRSFRFKIGVGAAGGVCIAAGVLSPLIGVGCEASLAGFSTLEAASDQREARTEKQNEICSVDSSADDLNGSSPFGILGPAAQFAGCLVVGAIGTPVLGAGCGAIVILYSAFRALDEEVNRHGEQIRKEIREGLR